MVTSAFLSVLASGSVEVLIHGGHRAQAYQETGFLEWFHAVTLHAVLVLPALAAPTMAMPGAAGNPGQDEYGEARCCCSEPEVEGEQRQPEQYQAFGVRPAWVAP
jgi:hypothetical protein